MNININKELIKLYDEEEQSYRDSLKIAIASFDCMPSIEGRTLLNQQCLQYIKTIRQWTLTCSRRMQYVMLLMSLVFSLENFL